MKGPDVIKKYAGIYTSLGVAFFAACHSSEAMAHNGHLSEQAVATLTDPVPFDIGTTAINSYLLSVNTTSNSKNYWPQPHNIASRSTVNNTEYIREVTLDGDINKYLSGVYRYMSEQYKVNPGLDPTCIGKLAFRLLPPRDPTRDPYVIGTTETLGDPKNDMRTLVNGLWIDTTGRYTDYSEYRNCEIDLKNITSTGPMKVDQAEGNYETCEPLYHEALHTMNWTTSETRNFEAPYPENDRRHDTQNKGSLMYFGGSGHTFGPCTRQTIDKVRYTLDYLIDIAKDDITVYKTAQKDDKTVSCEPLSGLRAICYINGRQAKSGRLLELLNKYTKDGEPQLKKRPRILPPTVLKRYVGNRSISTWLYSTIK